MAEITVSELVKEYQGGTRGVDTLSVTINDGEFFALLGPSGCGKTTLLRTIAGLEQATGGSIRIGSREVTRVDPGRRGVTMVFQDYALFPHMTVAENIGYPLRIQRVAKTQRHDAAKTVAEELSLSPFLDRRPAQLSGGQQQRVALARAIVSHPDVCLLDEPLSNLDARLRLEARTFLKRLQRELGITTVFVTHDQAEALALADRMAVMKDGRIQQIGTPREVFDHPANVFVASFIGSVPMNLVPARINEGMVVVARQQISAPDGVRTDTLADQELTWGCRPEYCTITYSNEPNTLQGVVHVTENLGASQLITIALPDDTLIQAIHESDIELGTPVGVTVAPSRTRLFDESGLLVESERFSSPSDQ